MNIVIVGLGYVGVTAAACLSSQGHTVCGVDVNEQKAQAINSGLSPITETGVSDLIANAVERGTLTAAVTLPALDEVDVVIVCVGTPSAPDGSHNMGFIAESTRQLASAASRLREGHRVTITFRSTFKPGTMDDLIAPIFSETIGESWNEKVELIYNPEFLRESTAVADYFAPPKIVIGSRDGQPSAMMERLNDGIDSHVFNVPFREAEITKFIDNTWHAVKVAFANEVGRVCRAYGVDARQAHEIFIADTKLNISSYYTRPGGAFGGSCLPKDVRAMQSIAHAGGASTSLFDSLIPSNEAHKEFQLARVTELIRPGASVLVAGLAFKAGTDDMRESPNVTLVSSLIEQGYQVRVFDPAIKTSSLIGQNLGYVLTAIPNLREILVGEEDLQETHFDLIVVNNATGSALPKMDAEVLDLQSIDSGTR